MLKLKWAHKALRRSPLGYGFVAFISPRYDSRTLAKRRSSNVASALRSDGKIDNAINKYLKKKRTKRDSKGLASRESILDREIKEFVEGTGLKEIETRNSEDLIRKYLFSNNRPHSIIESVKIQYETSEGEGLAAISKRYYVKDHDDEGADLGYTILKVPKAWVGDIVNVKILMHHQNYADAELLKVLNPSSRTSDRKEEQIICPKFQECSGCQLQMLAYENQLKFKSEIIRRAYRFFFPSLNIFLQNKYSFGNIVPSPLQYSYRLKLTPHTYVKMKDIRTVDRIEIGFNNAVPGKHLVDVEYCPIASQTVNDTLKVFRSDISKRFENENSESLKPKKMRNMTLLLRDSLSVDQFGNVKRVCITNGRQIATEKVGDNIFQFNASDFFQNNVSILEDVIDYIAYHIKGTNAQLKYVVDTYCGSGLLGIVLHSALPDIERIFGIEVSQQAIRFAKHNAHINGLNDGNKICFVEGSSDALFNNESFKESGITGQKSIIIMDPSRKGSNKDFLRQVLKFRPRLLVYVSCNVFTQARDLADFFAMLEDHNVKYIIRDIVGFDFFPQTKHVETVAILELCD